MLKRILLLTDFSEHSFNAIQYGLSLYQHDHCKFTLLSILENKNTTESQSTLKNASKFLAKIAKDLKKQCEDCEFEFEYILVDGRQDTFINRFIEHENIELAIMGTKESGTHPDNLMNNPITKIILNIDCPVMVIPEKAKFKSSDKIIFNLDFKRHIPELTFQPLLHLAKKFRSEIFLFGLMENEEDLLAAVAGLRINKFLEGIPHSFYTPHPEDAAVVVNNFLKKEKPFLMVFNIGRINPIEKTWKNYLTKKLLADSQIPLLILHETSKHSAETLPLHN